MQDTDVIYATIDINYIRRDGFTGAELALLDAVYLCAGLSDNGRRQTVVQ
jgi:hypothetical protein